MEAEHVIDLDNPVHQENPYPTYAMMLEHYPVCRVKPTEALAVTRYDDVKFVLKRYDIFSSAGCRALFEADWLKPECRQNVLVFKDPPEHTKHRPLVKKPFAKHIIKQLAPAMEALSQDLLGSFRHTECDFLEGFAFPFVGGIFLDFIGMKSNQSIQELRHWVDTAVTLSPVKPNDSDVEYLEKVLLEQKRHFLAIINDRRANPRDDMVTELVNAEIDGEKVDDRILVDMIDLLVMASFHTVIHTLSKTVLWLSRNPDMIRQLKHSANLIPAFIEEMLRLNSSGHSTFRVAVRDYELSGTTIPAGTLVLPIMAAANRDPRHFPNPDAVDLGRNNLREHLSFGFGPHTCPGAELARLELGVALGAILANCDDIYCDEKRIKLFNTVTAFGYKALPIKLLPE